MVKITRCYDLELLRELHYRGFPDDDWPGDDQTYWTARGCEGVPIGFVSAKCERGKLFLSRVAVFSERGTGLGRRLLRVAERWGRRMGVKQAWTYVAGDNYPSINNMVKLGYSVTIPAKGINPKKFLMFRRFL